MARLGLWHWLSEVERSSKSRRRKVSGRETALPTRILSGQIQMFSVGKVQNMEGVPVPGFTGHPAQPGTGRMTEEGAEQIPEASGYMQNSHLITTKRGAEVEGRTATETSTQDPGFTEQALLHLRTQHGAQAGNSKLAPEGPTTPCHPLLSPSLRTGQPLV